MTHHLRAGCLAALLLTSLGWAPSAAVAADVAVWIEGAAQGPIEGWGSWPGLDDLVGREGSMAVVDYHHLVQLDAGGAKQHEAVIFTKRFDKASPKLLTAYDTGEILTTVEFRFFRVDAGGGGGLEHYFTIQLDGARAVAIEPICGESGTECLERVRLSGYPELVETWEPGGITGTSKP